MGSAQYELLADNAADVHENLINRLGARAGERWLDLATGTGAVAMRAAARGAIVTARLAATVVELEGVRGAPERRVPRWRRRGRQLASCR